MAKHKTFSALSAAAMAMGAFSMLPTAVMAGTSNVELDENLTLTESVAACYVVKAESNVTIDLGGFDITCADGSAITVEKGATATIKGTGNVISKTGGAAVFNKGGNVTIESGTYQASNWYTVKNLGDMTIKNGTFDGVEHTPDSSLIVNGWYNGKGSHGNDKGVAHEEGVIATLTIQGGKFYQYNTTSMVKSDDYSKTYINGGTFVGSEKGKYLVQASGAVEINGGEFTSKSENSSLVWFNATGEEGYTPGTAKITNAKSNTKYLVENNNGVASLEVTGGTFEGLTGIVNPRGAAAGTYSGKGISGGSFNIAPEALIAEGYEFDDETKEVVSETIDYKDETERSDTTKAKQDETPVEGSVRFIGDAEIDRKGYFLILDHGTDGLTPKETSDTHLEEAYDLNMYDRDGNVVPIEDAEMRVQIVLSEEQYNKLKEYDAVKAVYFNEDGIEEGERIDARLGTKGRMYFVEFTATHFSTYGLVGMNAEIELDDETDDADDTVATPETGTMTAAGASATNAGILAAATAVVMSVIAGIVAFIKRK